RRGRRPPRPTPRPARRPPGPSLPARLGVPRPPPAPAPASTRTARRGSTGRQGAARAARRARRRRRGRRVPPPTRAPRRAPLLRAARERPAARARPGVAGALGDLEPHSLLRRRCVGRVLVEGLDAELVPALRDPAVVSRRGAALGVLLVELALVAEVLQ